MNEDTEQILMVINNIEWCYNECREFKSRSKTLKRLSQYIYGFKVIYCQFLKEMGGNWSDMRKIQYMEIAKYFWENEE